MSKIAGTKIVPPTNPQGATAADRLFAALRMGSDDDVLAAVANGAAVNEVDELGKTALSLAISRNCSANVIQAMVDAGAELDTPSFNGKTGMYELVEAGHRDIVAIAVRRSVAIDSPSTEGRTPLFAAVETDDAAMAGTLLDARSNPHHRDMYGLTPLCHARSAAIVDLLVSAGADVRESLGITRNGGVAGSPLMYAAKQGSLGVCGMLIELGSPVQGILPLLFKPGSKRDNGDIIGLLCAKGAAVDERGHRGNLTALLACAAVGDPASAVVLIDQGADVEARDARGNTPLLRAAEYGNAPMVVALHEAGADPTARNKVGKDLAVLARPNQEVRAVVASWQARSALRRANPVTSTPERQAQP